MYSKYLFYIVYNPVISLPNIINLIWKFIWGAKSIINTKYRKIFQFLCPNSCNLLIKKWRPCSEPTSMNMNQDCIYLSIWILNNLLLFIYLIFWACNKSYLYKFFRIINFILINKINRLIIFYLIVINLYILRQLVNILKSNDCIQSWNLKCKRCFNFRKADKTFRISLISKIPNRLCNCEIRISCE